MGELQNILDSYIHRNEIQGIACLTNKSRKLNFSSSGNFHKDKTSISLQDFIPLGNIFELFISAYVTLIIDDYDIQIRDPLHRLLPEVEIVGHNTSFMYLQLDHLLSHTSGFAKYRNSYDIIKGEKSQFSKDLKRHISLSKYLSTPITRIESPENLTAQNNFNYALVARIVENLVGKPFNQQMAKFLSRFEEGIDPFSLNFTPGYVGKGGNKKFERDEEMKYYHLYPSTMASMSFDQFNSCIFKILFDNIDVHYLQYYLFEHQIMINKYADKVGIPLRHRQKIGFYELNSKIHGYTLSLVIHPEDEFYSLVVINNESPHSKFLTNKIQRLVLKENGYGEIISYQLDSKTEITDQYKNAVKGTYKIFRKSNILTSLYDNQIGGELKVGEKERSLYFTTLNDGLFLKSSQYSRLSNLKLLEVDGNNLIFGFDDGLYYSKFIVMDYNYASRLYIELDQGPSIYHTKKRTNFNRISRNIVINFSYLIYFLLFPVIRQKLGELRHIRRNSNQLNIETDLSFSEKLRNDFRQIKGKSKVRKRSRNREKIPLTKRFVKFVRSIFSIATGSVIFVFTFIHNSVILVAPFVKYFFISFKSFIVNIPKVLKKHIARTRRDNLRYKPKLKFNSIGFINLVRFSDQQIFLLFNNFSRKSIPLSEFYKYYKSLVRYKFAKSKFNVFNFSQDIPIHPLNRM